MIRDDRRLFDRFYKESSREAESLANEAVKELYCGCGSELILNPAERLMNGIRFQTIPGILGTNALVFLALIVCAVAVATFRKSLGVWGEVIYLGTELAAELFVLTYMILSVWTQDRAWHTVSPSERKDLTAALLVDKWVTAGREADDLVPAFKSSLDTLRKYQTLVKGSVVAAGAFLTFFKLLFGERISLHETVLAPLVLSPRYGAYVYAAIFLLALIAMFVRVIAPIAWREGLEPHLLRAVERHNRSRADS
jgi:hypothetical protein